jgi:hypothetical protein
MKKSIFHTGFFFTLIAIGYMGCKEYKPIDMNQVTQLEDTILKSQLIPGTSSIHTLQDADYTKVKVIIGNVSLYSAGTDAKQNAAIKVGTALLHILGPDNNLSSATLVITKEVRKDVDNPPDGISLDMKFDSLKKAINPGK